MGCLVVGGALCALWDVRGGVGGAASSELLGKFHTSSAKIPSPKKKKEQCPTYTTSCFGDTWRCGGIVSLHYYFARGLVVSVGEP